MITIELYGPLGYETASELFDQHEEELRNRFSRRFLEDFRRIPASSPADLSLQQPFLSESPFLYVASIGEGGLAGALWNACEEIGHVGIAGAGTKPGCRVELLRVPIRQEVVEICELYEENPYETASGGCFLVIRDRAGEAWTGDGVYKKALLSILEESVMIGKLTNDGRRMLLWDDSVRYLTPPQRQTKDIMDRKNGVHIC